MSNIKTNSLVEIAREFYTIQEMASLLFCDASGLRRRIEKKQLISCGNKGKAKLYTYYQFLYLKGEL